MTPGLDFVALIRLYAERMALSESHNAAQPTVLNDTISPTQNDLSFVD
jgi:hypothetical protein